jgi:hypothetical protein
MSKHLVSKKALNNIDLQDLSPVLREVTEEKQDWVYRYCDQSKIGRAVYEDFIKYNSRVMNAEDTFMFSVDMPTEGILSTTQAFQVIATTLESFDIDEDEKLAEQIRQQITRVFEKILNAVIQPDGGYKFDATPYLPNNKHFSEDNYKYAYIDSMTWVMSAILAVFRMHIKGICTIEDGQLEKAKDLYKYCIRYLLESYIPGDKDSGKFVCGWNYTKGCSDPSLYFTFAISELMIDILDTFENVIRDADIDLIHSGIDEALQGKTTQEEIDAKKEQVEKRYKENRENLQSGTARFKREQDLFRDVNEGFSVYAEQSPYAKLEALTKQAVHNIWNMTKNKLATDFFASDLQSNLPESVIEQSLQSDAVFNTIFVINAMINAGLDEDADDTVTYFTPNGSQEYDEALAEYDMIRDTLRIAYDNAYQFYLKMEKKKKDYKINEYTLNFDERFKGLEEKVSELRKARIRVFSLMPLLVKTKTTLGEFVIQYPQYDMQIYLESILQYRCVRTKDGLEDDYYWTWERSGYSSSSNYYFFSALNDFFNYYNKYELPASKNAQSNEAARQAVRKAYLEELERSDGAIGQLEAAKQKLEEEKQGLEAEKAQLEANYAALLERFNNDPLRKALNDFVCTVVREHILNMASVGDLLTVFAENLTASAQARVARKAEEAQDRDSKKTAITEQQWYRSQVEEAPSETQKLEDGLRAFGSALISERLLEMLYADKRNTEHAQQEYPEIAKKARADMEEVIRYYLAPQAGGQPSDYVATKGYSGLPQILNREKANQKNNRNG